MTGSAIESAATPATWRVVAACRAGGRHSRNGESGEDALRWEQRDGLLVAALADGAGSAEMASMGAQLAAEAAIAPAFRRLRESDRTPVELSEAALAGLTGARNALRGQARHLGRDYDEFMTTLIVVVAGPNGVGAAQIGDGAVVVAARERQAVALTQPHRGELANETECLASEHALETAQVVASNGEIAMIAIFTDGLQRLALRMSDLTPHGPFFNPLFDRFDEDVSDDDLVAEMEEFLISPRVRERTEDDVTLLIAALEGPDPEPPPRQVLCVSSVCTPLPQAIRPVGEQGRGGVRFSDPGLVQE